MEIRVSSWTSSLGKRLGDFGLVLGLRTLCFFWHLFLNPETTSQERGWCRLERAACDFLTPKTKVLEIASAASVRHLRIMMPHDSWKAACAWEILLFLWGFPISVPPEFTSRNSGWVNRLHLRCSHQASITMSTNSWKHVEHPRFTVSAFWWFFWGGIVASFLVLTCFNSTYIFA